MKKTFFTFLLALIAASAFPQLNMQLLDQMGYPTGVNDVWGWADPSSNAEYAFVGLNTGVSIVDVTTPTDIHEVQFISGPNSTWRDIKTWGNFAYVTNETGGGLLVIDMSGAPNNITWEYKIFNIPGWGNLTDCHNLYIDEFGYCYLAGCNLNSGDMLTILDVFTDPANPTVVYSDVAEYAHDYFAQNNKLYASHIYTGDLGIYDVTNKQNIIPLALQPTPYNFTHNAWVNAENTVVFTTDEKANAPVAAYDITDLDDIRELDQFRPIATLNKNVIPHNVHVWDNWLIISYYTDGGIVADASRPENIIEVGNFDTWLGANGNYNGSWGAYPFLPSGIILLSDRQSGLFVCGPTYVRACWLEGKITNSDTGAPIFGAEVNIASSQANYATSNPSGNYKTGQAIPGTFNVTFSAMGYISKTVPAILENGVLTILDVQLDPIVPVDEFSGQVISAIDGSPVAAAQVVLESETFRFTTITNMSGQFVFNNIFKDEYTLAAAKWGHKHALASNVLIDQNTAPITLKTHLGYQDDFFTSQGWTTQTTATGGWWTRGIPVGTLLNGALANPDVDVPNDIGNQCFMTGNNGGAPGDDDVDAGYVRLISPVMDLTLYYEPVVSYNTWFFNGGNSGMPNDTFEIRISNGTEEVVLETITTSGSAWNDRSSFKVSDYLAITNNMKIIFEAKDDAGNNHIVEAAVDAFLVEDSAFPLFEFSGTEGCPTHEVGFDESSGYAYQWGWSFENGDPATSDQPDVLVGFSTPGQHDINLEVMTKTGAVFTLEYPDFVTVLELPAPSFNYTNFGGSVSFVNTSANATSYFWSFNDGAGSTSDLPNPSFTYSEMGMYEVTLAATNDCGTNYFTATVTIDAVPPIANISVDQTSGCGPLIVEFYDESENAPTVWNWTFPGGNPASSTEQNPVVSYQTSGTYSVQLEVTNSAGNSQISVPDLILVNEAPAPEFTFSVAGPTVVFANNTTNAISYQWQFNDGLGSVSDQENPTFTFPGIGHYDVVLSATNACGTNNYTQTVSITAVQPTALFTSENSTGCAPLVVQFFDQSMGGEINSWDWTFPGGNPSTSSEQNPIVTYPVAGNYNVSLDIANPVGQNFSFIFNAVTVVDTPTVSFSYDINGPVADFTSISPGVNNWVWHFGDNNNSTSTEANPTFEYNEIGTYTVKLEASNECGTSQVEQEVTIITVPPKAAFQISNPTGCAPLEVSFTDLSSGGGITNWEWTFPGGNPTSSTDQNPTVTYAQPGTYDVVLKITNPSGENEFTELNVIIIEDVPTTDFNFIVNGPSVEFTNTSINANGQTWYFGDVANSSSDIPNPVFVYENTGTYTVVLETTNNCGTGSISQEIEIEYVSPDAAIVVSGTEGCTPFEVTFMDGSTGGGISTWEWGFPGGNPSSSTQPTQDVIYDAPGVYPVTLKVTNPVGESEITLSDLIIVDSPPEAGFAFSINGPEVQFTNLSIFGNNYSWDMGDGIGTDLTELNPFYTFPGVGGYEVSLSSTNDCGTDVYTQTVVIVSPTNIFEKGLSVPTFYAAPNPFSGQTKVVYEIRQPFENGQIILTNILGEIISAQTFYQQKGEIYIGENIGVSGVYFLQLLMDGKKGDVLKLVKY